MTIDDVLKLPDADILKSGNLAIIVVKEWHRITGLEPEVCDCKLKTYLRTVRSYKETLMKNDVYFDGVYYDKDTMPDDVKERLFQKHPSFYIRLFGEKSANVTVTVKKPAKAKKDEAINITDSEA
jgi:hypothetical protein